MPVFIVVCATKWKVAIKHNNTNYIHNHRFINTWHLYTHMASKKSSGADLGGSLRFPETGQMNLSNQNYIDL